MVNLYIFNYFRIAIGRKEFDLYDGIPQPDADLSSDDCKNFRELFEEYIELNTLDYPFTVQKYIEPESKSFPLDLRDVTFSNSYALLEKKMPNELESIIQRAEIQSYLYENPLKLHITSSFALELNQNLRNSLIIVLLKLNIPFFVDTNENLFVHISLEHNDQGAWMEHVARGGDQSARPQKKYLIVENPSIISSTMSSIGLKEEFKYSVYEVLEKIAAHIRDYAGVFFLDSLEASFSLLRVGCTGFRPLNIEEIDRPIKEGIEMAEKFRQAVIDMRNMDCEEFINRQRLEAAWEYKEQKDKKHQPVTQLVTQATIFKWVGETAELDRIDKILFEKQYIKTKDSFSNLFLGGGICHWLFDPVQFCAFWTMLVKEKSIVKLSEGQKGKIPFWTFACRIFKFSPNYKTKNAKALSNKWTETETRIQKERIKEFQELLFPEKT